MTGYSGTPLARKLGLKDGQRVAWINRPTTHVLLTTSRAFIAVDETTPDHLSGPYDVIHMFTDDRTRFETVLPHLLKNLDRNGMIWISWPKKASKVPTDMSEDVIRNAALKTTLVDVKVCAVDEIWSGLKLVIRKEHRPDHTPS